MKKEKIAIKKDGEGKATLVPECREDIWHIYNLVAEGDLLRAATQRKVTNPNSTSTASCIRIKLTLTIMVKSIDIDLKCGTIRFSGQNQTISKYIAMGKFHTIQIGIGKVFTVTKTKWDSLYRERLYSAINTEKIADLAILLMQQGRANLYLVCPFLYLQKASIKVQIPKKRYYSEKSRENSIEKFYKKILFNLRSFVDFEIVKCCIIASPGFYKDDFKKWLIEKAKRENDKFITLNMDHFVFCHSSSAYKSSITEILEDKSVKKIIENAKNSSDIKIFNDFLQLLGKNEGMAAYGLKYVEKAVKMNAVKNLLITDELVKSFDVNERKNMIKLTNRVKNFGGKIHTISVLNNFGEQLKGLNGIAAILNYSVPEPEDDY